MDYGVRRLTGRDAELASVMEELRLATDGAGRSVALLGEAGAGKSHLVREVCQAATSAGMTVLIGRSVPDSGTPLRALTEALVAGTRGTELASAPALDPYRAVLAPLIPGLDSAVPEQPAQAQFSIALAEGVRRLIEFLAGSAGLLLVQEDMHWADSDSALILEYLADHLQTAPVLVLSTAQPQPATPWAGRLRALKARGSASIVTLSPLDADGVAALAAELLEAVRVPEQLTGWLFECSDGNPSLVESLVRTAVATGDLRNGPMGWSFTAPERIGPDLVPEWVRDELRLATSALSADEHEVLRNGAALGRWFNASLLAPLTGLRPAAVDTALHALIGLRLLEPLERGVRTHRFTRALTHSAVLSELVGYRRPEIAAAALRIVRSEHPELAGGWSSYGAELAEAAGDLSSAARLLLESGRRALDAGSVSDAKRDLERARVLAQDERTRAEADRVMLQVLLFSGEIDEAQRFGRGLAAALDRSAAPAEQRLDVHLALARVATAASEYAEARDHLDAATALLTDARTDARARAFTALAEAAFAIAQERGDEAAELAQQALDAAAGLGDTEPINVEAVCEAHEVLGLSRMPWDVRDAEAEFAAALRTADERRLPMHRLVALNALGRLEGLETLRTDRLERAKTSADAAGAVLLSSDAQMVLAGIHTLRMDLPQSLDLARRCEDVGRTLGIGKLVPRALVVQAVGHALAQRHDDMERAVEAALGCRDVDDALAAYLRGQARAEFSLGREDRTQALAELDAAVKRLPQHGGGAWPMLGLWALLSALEDRNAERVLQQARETAWGSFPLIRAHLSFAEAITHGRASRDEEAVAAFETGERAFRTLEGAEWMHHRAWRLVSEAAIADGWGDPANWLRAALPTFAASGHTELATACRAMLRGMGVPVPRQRSSFPNPLFQYGITGRELEVLHLIAESLPSSEIGRRLGISTRTIEKHIERLKVKTGAGSRRELAGWLQRHG